MNIDCKEVADFLYAEYKKSDMGDYMVGRVKEFFYGLMVKDHIYKFKALHEFLIKNGHTVKNPYVYGDDDTGIWYEKSPKSYTTIIATERYCSCADDNTHIFILNELDVDYIKFLGVTAWPRQVSERMDHKWGDHRDIKHPSITTFRKHGFKFGYGDARDAHYCFRYESLTGCADDAPHVENRMLWALQTLTDDYEEIMKAE